MKVPEKVYIDIEHGRWYQTNPGKAIEYIHIDAFMKKAKEWFKQQSEYFDFNGIRRYGFEDFMDFLKYMKGD